MRDDPASAEVASHRLLLRAGFIRQLGSGLFSWLPLGYRVLRKVEALVRDEMEQISSQEFLMPFVQPAEYWEESGRWTAMGDELLRFKDRNGRNFCLSPTHEEVITDIFRNNISSYRQLPSSFFHVSLKFRDEVRPRFGLLRAREFIMKDAYTFHLDQASFDIAYQEMHTAYSNILSRIGLKFRAVEADTGMIGGSRSHEFHVLADSGEDDLAYSAESDYAANVEQATSLVAGHRQPPSKERRLVDTPGAHSIAEVAHFLETDERQCVKTLLVKGTAGLVALVIRGDHELNLIKAGKHELVNAPVEFAAEHEIEKAIGCSLGSIGPIGLDLPYIVDRDASILNDFVCGANVNGKHYIGVNWVRDVELSHVADIRRVQAGDPSPDGKGKLQVMKGIEVGHIFQLGTKYSKAMRVAVQDENGENVVPLMGCYGFGVTRTVAAIVEQCHDDDGIIWPDAVAPFQVHMISLGVSDRVQSESIALYRALENANIEVIWDDRDERPGVKFADADLIGIPHRLVIGDRGLANDTIEYRYQRDAVEYVSTDDAMTRVVDTSRRTP